MNKRQFHHISKLRQNLNNLDVLSDGEVDKMRIALDELISKGIDPENGNVPSSNFPRPLKPSASPPAYVLPEKYSGGAEFFVQHVYGEDLYGIGRNGYQGLYEAGTWDYCVGVCKELNERSRSGEKNFEPSADSDGEN